MTIYTDKMDVDKDISLYEYGIIRNPKTDKCKVCVNTHELDVNFGDVTKDSIKPKIEVYWISFDDVKEALQEADDGYFNFIGSTRENELKYLDNNYLTGTIHSMEMYNGWFDLN